MRVAYSFRGGAVSAGCLAGCDSEAEAFSHGPRKSADQYSILSRHVPQRVAPVTGLCETPRLARPLTFSWTPARGGRNDLLVEESAEAAPLGRRLAQLTPRLRAHRRRPPRQVPTAVQVVSAARHEGFCLPIGLSRHEA